MTEGICILGSTGSIGCSSLDVIRRNANQYSVEVLSANTNVEKMFAQCLEFKPQLAVMRDSESAKKLADLLDKESTQVKVLSGEQALIEAIEFDKVTTVIAAIVGAAGLLPTFAAVQKGLKILLANKEALVMSGELFMKAAEKSGALLLPVDSEHNAIFQCLSMGSNYKSSDYTNQTIKQLTKGVKKILLTGSGGPFRELPIDQLDQVTPEQACAHPNWDMGKKISVDSATMMNKGLELIEAGFLFGLNRDQIDIVIHPQSIVHSMVSYKDGSVLAQMGNPDMRTPIAHCLAWPNRIDAGVEPLDFYQMSHLSFEAPDEIRFPCLKLASEAMQLGGIAPCVLNAANEVAVNAFLDGKICFTDIAKVIQATMHIMVGHSMVGKAIVGDAMNVDSIESILQVDKQARNLSEGFLLNIKSTDSIEKTLAEKNVNIKVSGEKT